MKTGSVDKLFGRVAHPGCNYLSRVGRPCLECGWQEPKEKEVSQTETSLDKAAEEFADQEANVHFAGNESELAFAFKAGAQWALERMIATASEADLHPDFKDAFAGWLKNKVGMSGDTGP